MDINGFNHSIIDSHNFTKRSENDFYDAVDMKAFQDNDAETIFTFLKSSLKLITFGDYLKRYIYVMSGLSGNYEDVPIKEYQYTITHAFDETHTPKSFVETSAKMNALAKTWLTQASVNRSVVFLLGFGLGMRVEDVSEFLTKALRERDFNFKDPIEIIYWYCFKKGYNFKKMLSLKQQYEALEPVSGYTVHEDRTIGVRDTVSGIKDDESLLMYLARFRNDNHAPSLSVTTWQQFSELYQTCKSIIADYYNGDEAEQRETGTGSGSHKTWTVDDIDEGDVEKILCCGTPVNKSGNLEKQSASKLSKHFTNKRFSRQHIAALLSKSVAVDRFDLMTLNFFVFSQKKEYDMRNKARYIAFVDSTNEILSECMMGEMYIANPYECFLQMCIISECPLATYADVWEMSFEV